MNKFSFLTLALITSFAFADTAVYPANDVILDEEVIEKSHPCKKMAQGKYPKIVESMVTLIAASKFEMPEAVICALLPFFQEIVEQETKSLLNKNDFTTSQSTSRKVVAELTNGWNVILTALAMYGAAWLHYGQDPRKNEIQKTKTFRAILGTYFASQIAAILVARKAAGKPVAPYAKKKNRVIRTYQVQ
jgi:hypothetical protein